MWWTTYQQTPRTKRRKRFRTWDRLIPNVPTVPIPTCHYISWHISWENLRTCPWACCRFVLQGCLESPELHNHWLLSMYHNGDMWHSIWAISNGQFLILPPWPFYVVVSVRSLGSFVGKNRQQFAWIRTARSTPWRDGGNVVLGLGSRGLTVVQQIKLLGIQFLQWFCIYACFFFMSTLG